MILSIMGYLLAAKSAGVEEVTMLRHLKGSLMRRPDVVE